MSDAFTLARRALRQRHRPPRAPLAFQARGRSPQIVFPHEPDYCGSFWTLERGTWRERGVGETVSFPDGARLAFAAGLLPAAERDWLLRRIAAVVRRTAPWVTLHAGCRLHGTFPGEQPSELGGLADGAVVLLDIEIGRMSVLQTLHHELWHAAENMLTDDAVRSVDARGADGWQDPTYLDTPSERRARAYAGYASMRDEGIRPRLDFSRPGAAELFETVWRGDFALEAAAALAAA